MVFAVDMVYLLIPCIGRLKVYIVDAFVFICSKSSFLWICLLLSML